MALVSVLGCAFMALVSVLGCAFMALVSVLGCAWVSAQSDGVDSSTPVGREEASSWQPSGFVEARSRYLSTANDWLSNRLLVGGELKWTGASWRAFVSARAEYDPATRRYRNPGRSEVRESYLHHDGDRFDVTLGKQRIAWGVADGIGTIDRINAVDHRDPIENARTASRRPSWLARVEFRTQIGLFEGVWLPRGRDRKLPERGSPWETPPISTLRRDAAAGKLLLEVDDPHEPEYGLRYTRYGPGLDWGVAVFDGFTDFPIRIRQRTSGIELAPVRVRTWNGNVAAGLANATLRAELAFTPDWPGEAGRSRRWQAVFGWDRNFSRDLYVNLQGFVDYMGGSTATRGVTFALTRPVFGYAGTVAARGQLSSRGQRATELMLEYEWSDALIASARLVHFDGNPSSPLGAFRDRDFVEVAIRWRY